MDNPYSAPVRVSIILATSSGLSNTVSYYNPTIASTDVKVKFGGYDNPTVSGASGSVTDVVIPPMEPFLNKLHQAVLLMFLQQLFSRELHYKQVLTITKLLKQKQLQHLR